MTAGGSENIYYGDADCNKTIDISDVILTSRIATEDTSATITAQGKLNADCDGTPGISASDAVLIIKVVAMLISQSDLGK